MPTPHVDPAPPDATSAAAASAVPPGAGALVAVVGATAAALLLGMVPAWEGTVYGTYLDPAGIVTACTGHTEPGLRLGARYTPAECQAWLATDLVRHARAVQCIQAPAPLAPHQRAALISLAFNVGAGRAESSASAGRDGVCIRRDGTPSTIARRAAAGDIAGMCAEIERWVYVAGRDCRAAGSGCAGIVNRRAAERAMCEGRLTS